MERGREREGERGQRVRIRRKGEREKGREKPNVASGLISVQLYDLL